MIPRQFQGAHFDPNFRTALYDVTQGTDQVKWGTLATLGLKSEHHAIGFTWLYTRTASDTATLAEDTRGKQYFFPGHNPDDPTTPGHRLLLAAPYLRLETLSYIERTTSTLQLNGDHKFPELLGTTPEFEWVLAHSNAGYDEPDKRQFGSALIPARPNRPAGQIGYKPDAQFSLGNLQRIFKRIDEESDMLGGSLKIPFDVGTEKKGYVKSGAAYDDLHRSFDQDTFSNFNDNSTFIGGRDKFWSHFFPNENHPINAGTADVDYNGSQRIAAWYAMLDVPVTSFVNVIGGVRFESTSLAIVNIAEPDATWFPPGGQGLEHLFPGQADVRFDQDDWLPSVGLVVEPVKTVTFRASYNETVARQTFKELSPILFQEYLGGPIFVGNPELKMSALRNYDLRLDWTPYDGGLFSVSWFYKDIKRPIEYQQKVVNFDFTTAVNYPHGKLSGFELETRQHLGEFWGTLDGLRIGANATFIDSEVDLPPDEIARFNQPGIQAPMSHRHMTNAPEYLFNLFTTYDIVSTGTQAAIFYTVQGDTLIAGAGLGGLPPDKFVPSIYALPVETLNATISQELGKYFKLQIGAKNLTDPKIQEVYRSPYIGGDITKSSYTKGTEYYASVTVTVRL
jgi:TonB-dependent receptor